VLKGLLRGVAYGRPALGDVKLPGITWAARGALTARSGGDGLRRFWEAVDDTSLYLVGEEYPEFTGPPLRAARKAAAAQRAIYRWGDAGVSLGGKYVAGLTPGYELATGFGGNVRHRPRRAVEHWRLGYIRARAADGVAGFAEYNFNDRNALGGVMDDVLRALGKGVRLLLASRA
jgi:hypothetical protein